MIRVRVRVVGGILLKKKIEANMETRFYPNLDSIEYCHPYLVARSVKFSVVVASSGCGPHCVGCSTASTRTLWLSSRTDLGMPAVNNRGGGGGALGVFLVK